MGKINAGRVVLGGLLAGIIINAVEWAAYGAFLADDWARVMASLNRTMNESAAAMTVYVCWGFLIGILAVWVYAAVRPRFGAGVGTAIKTGVLMWLLVSVQWAISVAPGGLFPRRLVAIGVVISLVELVVATVAGAWLYKEEAA